MSLDPAEPKPEIHAIVAWPLAHGEVLLSKQDCVSLEEAEMLHKLGFVVLVDPADEAILARWEQMQRALKRQWKW